VAGEEDGAVRPPLEPVEALVQPVAEPRERRAVPRVPEEIPDRIAGRVHLDAHPAERAADREPDRAAAEQQRGRAAQRLSENSSRTQPERSRRASTQSFENSPRATAAV